MRRLKPLARMYRGKVKKVVMNTDHHYIALSLCYFMGVPYEVLGSCYLFIAINRQSKG